MRWWPFRDDRAQIPAASRVPALPERHPGPTRSQYKRFLSAAQNRLTTGQDVLPRHIDEILRRSLRVLRARARQQARDNDYAKRFIALAKSNIAGPTGITVQAQKRQRETGKLDTAANTAVEMAFREWGCRHADRCGRMSWTMFQHMAIANFITDGELLAMVYEGPDAGPFGFQIRLLDPERLDTDKNMDLPNGNRARLGVEYNEDGRVVAYWILDVDQNGYYVRGGSKRYAADAIIHVYLPEWPDQARGIPWLSAGLHRMAMLAGYEEAAVVAARTGASKGGYLEMPEGEEYLGDDTDADGNPVMEIEPGVIEALPAGAKFHSHDPSYPHEQFDAFMRRQLRGLTAGLPGASYSNVANDYSDANYSALRGQALEARPQWIALQEWFIDQLARPVFERWLSRALLARAIRLPNGAPLGGRFEEYAQARLQGPRWPWVDPQKEMQANKEAIGLSLISRSQIIRDSGRDPDEVFREIEAERAALAEKGIPLSAVDESPAMNQPQSGDDDD